MSKNSTVTLSAEIARRAFAPNFLRVEVMTYAKNQPSDMICWKLQEVTTSEDRARQLLRESNYNLRVVECCSHRRVVVDSNFR
jgi:hypothetical protein